MKYIFHFDEEKPDINLLGGKAYNLTNLSKNFPNIPPGFVISTEAYQITLKNSGNYETFTELVSGDFTPKDIIPLSRKLKDIILSSQIPYQLIKEIQIGYEELKKKIKGPSFFAVRSSANIEDINLLSFAGQAETYLYISTFDDLINTLRKCWISLFSPQALFYILKMRDKGFFINIKDVKMAVIVQKMINSEISGVLFTCNVVNNDINQMMINSTWGLGETIANNSINPDLIILNKNKFEIIKTIIGKKEKQSIKNPKGSYTILIENNSNQKNICSLNVSQIEQLYELGLKVENLFNHPQDIEWAIENNLLYLLQIRPITTLEKEKAVLSYL